MHGRNIIPCSYIISYLSKQDSPEVHANAAEILCAITRYAPPGLSAKICSPGYFPISSIDNIWPFSHIAISLWVYCDFPIMTFAFIYSFVGRLFHHALEVSRPQSVLVHSLAVCISLLDPKRLLSASNNLFRSNLSHGSLPTASPETIDGMLGSLGTPASTLENNSVAVHLVAPSFVYFT